MDFSERFKELKNLHRATYSEIAQYLGLNKRVVQYYAQGKRRPDFDGLIALANYFSVSVDYLLGLTNYNPYNKERSIDGGRTVIMRF